MKNQNDFSTIIMPNYDGWMISAFLDGKPTITFQVAEIGSTSLVDNLLSSAVCFLNEYLVAIRQESRKVTKGELLFR